MKTMQSVVTASTFSSAQAKWGQRMNAPIRCLITSGPQEGREFTLQLTSVKYNSPTYLLFTGKVGDQDVEGCFSEPRGRTLMMSGVGLIKSDKELV
jgi:hypothetical protein